MGRLLGDVVVVAFGVVTVLALYPTPKTLHRATARAADATVGALLTAAYGAAAGVGRVARRLRRRRA